MSTLCLPADYIQTGALASSSYPVINIVSRDKQKLEKMGFRREIIAAVIDTQDICCYVYKKF